MERVKPLTKKQCEKIIEQRAGICEMPTCFEMENLQVHHNHRRCFGGSNEPSNLQVLCKRHHKMIHFKEGPKK